MFTQDKDSGAVVDVTDFFVVLISSAFQPLQSQLGLLPKRNIMNTIIITVFEWRIRRRPVKRLGSLRSSIQFELTHFRP